MLKPLFCMLLLLSLGSIALADEQQGEFGDISVYGDEPVEQPIEQPTLPPQINNESTATSPLDEAVEDTGSLVVSPDIDQSQETNSPSIVLEPPPIQSTARQPDYPVRPDVVRGEHDNLYNRKAIAPSDVLPNFKIFQRRPGTALKFNYPLPKRFAITSRFGYRTPPCPSCSNYHQGLDLATPVGTPVLAMASGTVIRSGWFGGYGLTVDIDHGGWVSRYAHLSAVHVRPGMTIGSGTLVAETGATGLSTGPHLHLEIHRNGKPIDPLTQLASTGLVVINPTQLASMGLMVINPKHL